MDKKVLTEKLSEFIRIKEELVETEEISADVGVLKIRDTLLRVGNLLKENLCLLYTSPSPRDTR